MQDTFARARTRLQADRPSARATIGYLVYNLHTTSDYTTFDDGRGFSLPAPNFAPNFARAVYAKCIWLDEGFGSKRRWQNSAMSGDMPVNGSIFNY